MDGYYLDAILVPLSFFLTMGYHAYLWHCFKQKPSSTNIVIDSYSLELKLSSLLIPAQQGDDKKGMLAVQSLRNEKMVTILIASIAILFNLLLAALTNNAFNASNLFNTPFLGLRSGKTFVLKYGMASFLLLFSFFCSSMATGFYVDAIYLVNANSAEFASGGYTQTVFERGNLLALIGSRLLCISFPWMLWIFGPIPMAISSVALVWWLHELDFAGKILQS